MKNEFAAVLIAVALSACNAGTPPSASASPDAPAAATGAASPAAAADAATPAAELPPGPGPEEAVAVVRDYYAAINARDFESAYAKWGDDGAASRQPFAIFRDGYADTESVQATIGAAHGLEGAAGSRYIIVPVEVRSQQRDGSVRRYRGEFQLRAAMVDGASEEQRRWHLDSAVLQRLPD